MKECVANNRISRARRVVENTVTIAPLRFRIFRRPIVVKTELVIEVTKAFVMLHNFLLHGRVENRNRYLPPGNADEETSDGVSSGGWRAEGDNLGLNEVNQIGSSNYSRDAKLVRDDFRDYFFPEDGSLACQLEVNSIQTNFDEL